MNDVAFGELILRMVISLGIVLLLVFGAYLVVRQRQARGGGMPRFVTNLGRSRSGRSGGNGTRTAGSDTNARASKGTSRNALRVLGRVGVGRAANVVALQFADRVILLGATEGSAPAVLAELDLDRWHLATADDDRDIRTIPLPIDTAPRANGERATGESSDAVAASLGLIEALREATARRA